MIFVLQAITSMSPQFYIGGKIGGELFLRSFKQSWIQERRGNMAEDSIFEVPGITSKEFINETYGKTQGLIGGSMGANFPVHKLWNIMLEASSHFTFSSGISGNAKVSLKSNIGLFLGLGLEYDYIWVVYQPIRISSNDDAIDEEISARLKVLTGEIKAHDSDYPNFHTHQIYGLGSIGYHINLKNNWLCNLKCRVL